MICPSCNKQATSFLRNAITLQGVTVTQSLKGFLKCQHCGILLKITNFGKYFWYFYIPAIILLLLFVLLRKHLMNIVNIDAGIIWVTLVVMIFVTFTFGVWRNARVEKYQDSK